MTPKEENSASPFLHVKFLAKTGILSYIDKSAQPFEYEWKNGVMKNFKNELNSRNTLIISNTYNPSQQSGAIRHPSRLNSSES